MLDPETSSAEFFEAKYLSASDHDPWGFATTDYELQRYNAVIKALDHHRYKKAFEPGCSIGVLTCKLAGLCDTVNACDFSQTAVDVAVSRCAALPGVHIHCAAFTGKERWAEFDLVVLCEIGYYFAAEAWQTLVAHMTAQLRPGTTLLACHWLGHSDDHLQNGDAVHETLEHPSLQQTLSQRYDGFRLDRWTRR